LRAGLSQEALARAIGYKRATPISILERGSKVPSPRTIVKLAKGAACTTQDLLAGVSTPFDELRGPGQPSRVREDVLSDDDRDWLRIGRALPAPLRQQQARLLTAWLRELRAAAASLPATPPAARRGRKPGT
jgi:transcriptional regulator with XRE-family HTH domain